MIRIEPVPLDSVPQIAAVLVAAAVACSAFGLALGALGLRFRDVFLVSNVAAFLLLLLHLFEHGSRRRVTLDVL